MDWFGRQIWIRTALPVGVLYFLIGTLFALPIDHQRRWRLAAWVVSGAVYASHIANEHFRRKNTAVAIALHAAAAVALGGFLLAVAATIHATMVASHAPYRLFLLALVVWPIVTAVPAFLVALGVASMLIRFSTRAPTRQSRQ